MIDGRSTVTTGRGAIVLRVQNGYSFHEHGSVDAARAEAARLAERMGGEFVVLVPVAIVKPAPKTVEESIDLLNPKRDTEDEYPF